MAKAPTTNRDLPSNPNHEFDRRTLLLAGGGGAVWLGLTARLVQLQTLESEKLKVAAEDNQFDLRVKTAPRGVIHDRYGEPLASNKPDYRVLIVPDQAGRDLPYVLEMIGLLLDLDQRQRDRLAVDAKASPQTEIMLQATSWEEYTRIALRLPDLPGVTIETGLVRSYPHGPVFAHPIGYVGKPSKKEVETAREVDEGLARYLNDPAVRVGKTGLERTNEDALQGKPGRVKIEVDARGRRTGRAAINDLEPVAANPMILTLDAGLQTFAMQRIGEESASVVIMDVNSGDLYVMASGPGFEPSAFINGISGPDYRGLMDNDHKPLFHKAVTGTYPPGSTFKMITALAALDAGVDPEERVSCPGFFYFGGRRFHCWARGGHGTVNLHQGIKYSCDCYFYTMGLRAGVERIAKFSRAFGLDQKFDVGVPSVEKGLVPDLDWHRRRYKKEWQESSTVNISIGQGFMLASPLQLAVMSAHIANGGKPVWPRLVREGGIAPPPVERPELDIPAEHMKAVQFGMWAVSNEPGGTAVRPSQLGIEGVQMAGKTGTAQVRIITKAERSSGVRSNASLPWHLRDHALFVAFAPYDNPRYAVSCVVEHGGSGSKAAAPIAADVLRECLIRDPANRPVARTGADGVVRIDTGTAA
jgi:penicillin-binding protein 2